MRKTLNQKRRVETTLHNQPFYCMIGARHGKGKTFAIYRIVSDLDGVPRLMRIGELGHAIYNQKVIEFVRTKLHKRILIGKPSWDTLCDMPKHDLRLLTKTADSDITITVTVAQQVFKCSTPI